MSLFSTRNAAHTLGAALPPPPGASGFLGPDDPPPPPRPRRPAGVRFDADLDLCELDDRERPGPTWTGKGRELSRSHLIFRSRRMCYPGRRILAAVHLIDDQPVALFGRVCSCDYDGDGLYRVEIELLKVPERPEIADWPALRARRAV
ncbi:MAG: hypothetical protein WD749_11135 [Phycisphaerales bacterium]